MPTQPELWLQFYVLSAFVVLLLAISTAFSLAGYLLRPWFNRQDQTLHALPTDQYLAYFAWPVATVVFFSLTTSFGGFWLRSGGLTSFIGAAVLIVGAAAVIYAGLLSAQQLLGLRRNNPIELARPDNPATMRWASSDLIHRATALKSEMFITDVDRLRFGHKELSEIHDKLESRLKRVRHREPGQRLVAWSRELAARYTWVVSLGTLAAVVLAVTAAVAAVVARKDLLRVAGLSAVLVVSAVGLWWAGMWLRARTHARRTEALSEQLTKELNDVRSQLDEVDQHIREKTSQQTRNDERAAPAAPMPSPHWVRRLFDTPRRRRKRQ